MTPEEQQTWDLLTWGNDVDISTLEIDSDNIDAFLERGCLNSGKEMTDDQLISFANYRPDVIDELQREAWEYVNDYYYQDYCDDYEYEDENGERAR